MPTKTTLLCAQAEKALRPQVSQVLFECWAVSRAGALCLTSPFVDFWALLFGFEELSIRQNMFFLWKGI